MKVARLEVSAYRIPTETPEEDGTHHWESTPLILVEAVAENGQRGLGFSYTATAAAVVVREILAKEVEGQPVNAVGQVWQAMLRRIRNVGRPGVVATAISAVDIALWDLKARLAGQALFQHLGAYRDSVVLYGSGGFTNYSKERLADQLGGWASQGFGKVKMKIGGGWGTRPREDMARVQAAREAIGPDVELFVDANGAYTPKQAVHMAHAFGDYDVSYFEEPVSSDHLGQLKFVREQVPQAVAAGEYGYDPWYLRDMLQAGAVDILQADVTRCLGISGWLMAANLAYGFAIPFSGHTAPSIHAQVGCAAPQLEHVEYFYDHARIEQMLFDGAPRPEGGVLKPDPARLGLGLTLKRKEAQKWSIGT